MRELLAGYNATSPVAIEDVVALHAEFELIHPFQDGKTAESGVS